LVSLSSDADSTPVVERTGRFAVNLLSSRQRLLSERFAQTLPSPQKFDGVGVRTSPGGLPWILGALGTLDCEVVEVHRVADHVLIVGRVSTLELGGDEAPLVFYQGKYSTTKQGPEQRVAPGKQ
jgi:3-hydroxy-9,10-secoandrosta-1,3,5(10)-triene-9,17-dione monooxygenase reductase component